jgi:hypothetical protein
VTSPTPCLVRPGVWHFNVPCACGALDVEPPFAFLPADPRPMQRSFR